MPSLPEIGSSLPDVVLRTATVYLFLVAALRLSGKREVAQMSVLELVVILVISDAVQNSMVGDNTSVYGGLVAVVTLLTLDFLLRTLSRRSRKVRHVIEGEPRLIVRDGRLLLHAIEEEGLGWTMSGPPCVSTAYRASRTCGSRCSRRTARSA